MTAGIAVKSQPHRNERIAKTRLQIAAGAVREIGWGTGGRTGGLVSLAIAPFYKIDGQKQGALQN
jgi:hypothetical protein